MFRGFRITGGQGESWNGSRETRGADELDKKLDGEMNSTNSTKIGEERS